MLVSLRSDVEKDLNDKFEKLQKEKEDCDAKLILKKKELREQDQQLNKQINTIEKEKAIILEKLSASETKKNDMKEYYEKDTQSLNLKIKTDQANFTKDLAELNKEITHLKKQTNEMEQILVEKNATLEKETLLWEGKFKFLEQQKDTAKKELSEAQKKFESTLESFQKRGNTDLDKIEHQHQTNLTLMEQRYQQQLKDQSENHQKIYLELTNTNKELDREIKSLAFQSDLKNKQNDISGNLQKKIIELTELNEKLKKEVDDSKKCKEDVTIDLERKAEKERVLLKQKQSELENKVRDLEAKSGALKLEYEREKVKWNLEKDHLNNKNNDLQEQIDRHEKKNENIVRENEKLKNDKISMKRQRSGTRLSTIQSLSSSYMQSNITHTPNQKDKKELSMYINAKIDYPSNISTQGYYCSATKETKSSSNKELYEYIYDDLKSEENNTMKTDGNFSVVNTAENINIQLENFQN